VKLWLLIGVLCCLWMLHAFTMALWSLVVCLGRANTHTSGIWWLLSVCFMICSRRESISCWGHKLTVSCVCVCVCVWGCCSHMIKGHWFWEFCFLQAIFLTNTFLSLLFVFFIFSFSVFELFLCWLTDTNSVENTQKFLIFWNHKSAMLKVLLFCVSGVCD